MSCVHKENKSGHYLGGTSKWIQRLPFRCLSKQDRVSGDVGLPGIWRNMVSVSGTTPQLLNSGCVATYSS